MSRVASEHSNHDGMSNVWLYSFSPDVGLRAQVRLPTVVVTQPNASGLPKDFAPAVASILEHFDSLALQSLGPDDTNTLISGVLIFARSRAAWTKMPPLDSVPSIHVVVVDWRTPAGDYVIHAMGASGGVLQPLAPVTVEQVARQGMARAAELASQDQPKR